MKKTGYHLLLLILFFACLVGGCGEGSYGEVEAKGDQYFYDETKGKVYTDYSQNFDIKIEQWKYYYDTESSRDRILLSIAIKNKTHQELDDFVAVINLNPDAADLVASGILVYDQFEPYDLIPRTTANGASCAIDFLVETDDWLQEVKADKNELLDEIRSITLELSWKGGNETIELMLDELIVSNEHG